MCLLSPWQESHKGAECEERVQEAEDHLAYEKEVNDALTKHVRDLEAAHKNRETDWHELSNKWKKYEQDAIAENHRCDLTLCHLVGFFLEKGEIKNYN